MANRIDVEKIIKLFSARRTSIQAFWDSINELKPNRDNAISFSILIIISLVPAGIIAFSTDTIELFGKAIDSINTIILALFSIVFTGYVFFQALMSKELLKRLLVVSTENKTMLQINNEYFVNIMMLDILAVIINIFLMLIFKSIPNNFYIFKDIYTNNIIAFIGLWTYLSLMILIIWEMKSFVFNVFQLFNAYAGTKALELLDDDEDE